MRLRTPESDIFLFLAGIFILVYALLASAKMADAGGKLHSVNLVSVVAH